MTSIIAVGVEIDPENLRAILQTHDLSDAPVRILAGVWYGEKSRGVSDAIKSDKDLKEWFIARKKTLDKAFVSKIHHNKKKTIVVGEVMCGNEAIYVFFVNTNNVSTSQVKKFINSGTSDFITITFDRITLTCRPYLHQIVDNKIVISYE